MVVPGINDIAEDFTPKLIGDLDFNAGKRRAVYGTVAGVVGTVILVYFVFFYNAWERGNKDQLLAMAYQAEQTLSSGKRAEAVDQYQKFVDAIGSHELADSVLISKRQAAQSAISSWRDDQKEEARKAAEAKAQSAQPYYGGNTTTEQPRVGHVNYSLVGTFKSSWQREGWKDRPREEQAKAIVLMQELVETDCPDPLDREATLDYIEQTIGSW